MTEALVKYDAMCRAIDAAYEVDEVKVIRDQAIAWEIYSRQAKNFEAERRACEIRLRAEKKAGQLSKRLETSPGARTDLEPRATMARGSTKQETLAAAGVSPHQAKRWERLADVPEDQFEAALAGPDKPTTSGLIEAAKPKVTPVATEALRLWSALRDFERESWLAQDPEKIMETMTAPMRADAMRLAPLVAEWLGRISDVETRKAAE